MLTLASLARRALLLCTLATASLDAAFRPPEPVTVEQNRPEPTFTWGEQENKRTCSNPYMAIIGPKWYNMQGDSRDYWHQRDRSGRPQRVSIPDRPPMPGAGLQMPDRVKEVAKSTQQAFRALVGKDQRCLNTLNYPIYGREEVPQQVEEKLSNLVRKRLLRRVEGNSIDCDGFILVFVGHSYESKVLNYGGWTMRYTMGDIARTLVVHTMGEKPILIVDMTTHLEEGYTTSDFYTHDTTSYNPKKPETKNLGLEAGKAHPQYITLAEVPYHPNMQYLEVTNAYLSPEQDPFVWQFWWYAVGCDPFAYPIDIPRFFHNSAYEAYWEARIPPRLRPLWHYRYPIGIYVGTSFLYLRYHGYGLPSLAILASRASTDTVGASQPPVVSKPPIGEMPIEPPLTLETGIEPPLTDTLGTIETLDNAMCENLQQPFDSLFEALCWE